MCFAEQSITEAHNLSIFFVFVVLGDTVRTQVHVLLPISPTGTGVSVTKSGLTCQSA